MLAFWILFVLCGLSVFAWSMVIWNLGVVPSFLIGVATVLVLRGAASYIKRALVLRDSMADEADAETRTLDDRWTVVTADGSLSAHFEHTLWCTAKGPQILTAPEGKAAVAA